VRDQRSASDLLIENPGRCKYGENRKSRKLKEFTIIDLLTV